MSDIDKDTSDEDLLFVREKRKNLINSLTSKGMPEDFKQQSILLTALADMDRVSLGKKKIKIDKDVGDMQKQAIELIATLYKNPHIKTINADHVEQHISCVLDDNNPIPESVPGEMGSIGPTDNYDSFMSRMQA